MNAKAKLIHTLILLSLSSPIAGAYDFGKVDTRAIPVSLVQLLCNPDTYAGKNVRVTGVFNWHADDGGYLFLTRDHYRVADLRAL